MNLDVVRYLVNKGDEALLPPARMTGYDYILARNGVFKRALNRHVECCLPLVGARVAGLAPVDPYVRLRWERLPERALHLVLADAKRRAWARPVEAMYHLVREDDRLRVLYPRQESSAARIVYEGGENPAIVCELHSHCEMGHISATRTMGMSSGFGSML